MQGVSGPQAGIEFPQVPLGKSEIIGVRKQNRKGRIHHRLKPRGDAQKLLREAAAAAIIYRFELVEPSLEEIFIQTVGGKADA